MQRIPAFNPGDITVYPNANGTISVGAADAGSKMLLYNESPFNLDIDFLNGNVSILHAWEARYWTLDGDTRQVEWQIDTSMNVVNPPISAVMGELYGSQERIEGTYPVALIRQIGGQQAIVTGAATVQNDGNTLLQVVEATLQGHGSSDVIINNDGSYTLKGAGLLAAVGILTHILGTLTVDQLVTMTLGCVLPNNIFYQGNDSGAVARSLLGVDATNKTVIRSAGAGLDIQFQDQVGTVLGHFNTGGGGLAAGQWNAPGGVKVTNGSIGSIAYGAFTPPSGISTITHNFGFVPVAAFWSCGQMSNVNPGTTTAAIYNCLANTCTINNFAGVNGFLLYIHG